MCGIIYLKKKWRFTELSCLDHGKLSFDYDIR